MAAYRQKPCAHWTKGHCQRGDDCTFSHAGPGGCDFAAVNRLKRKADLEKWNVFQDLLVLQREKSKHSPPKICVEARDTMLAIASYTDLKKHSAPTELILSLEISFTNKALNYKPMEYEIAKQMEKVAFQYNYLEEMAAQRKDSKYGDYMTLFRYKNDWEAKAEDFRRTLYKLSQVTDDNVQTAAKYFVKAWKDFQREDVARNYYNRLVSLSEGKAVENTYLQAAPTTPTLPTTAEARAQVPVSYTHLRAHET